jgi:hypothetical protein
MLRQLRNRFAAHVTLCSMDPADTLPRPSV